jgi:ATP-binding cassette subfamily B protein/subfamily B ATP-binding cassette protein MsbA
VSPGARLLVPYVRREWRSLATVGVTTGVAAAADLARPLPLALVINALIAEAGGPAGFELDRQDLWLLAGVAALVIGIAIVDALATYVADIRLKRAGERISHDLRLETHAELQRLSLGYHSRRPAGDLVTRVTSDVHAVGGIFSESLGTVVSSVLLLVGMLVVAMLIDPVLALTAFAIAPLLALAALRNRRRLKAAARWQRRREGEIASLTTETLGAIREVKALGSERHQHEQLRRKSEERRDAGIETYRIETRYARLIDLVGAVGTAAVLVVGVLRVSAGAVSVGELVVMVAYTKRLSRPMRDLARQAARVTRALVRADRIAEILDAGEALEERPNAYRGGRAAGALTLEGVEFAYERAQPVLRDVTLVIPPGQRISLVGPSGAGKSTVAALLARFYDPQAGRVAIDGRDLRDCSLDWLREQVGLLLQEPILFTGTVAENIGYGIAGASDEQVVAAAKAAGAHEFVERLPLGYETPLGARGEGLSGGQKQRLAIARTLLRDPAVLVLDEPTNGLDEASEDAVLAGLERLMRGRTVLVITHSSRLAALADRTVALKDGRIAFDSDTEHDPRPVRRPPTPTPRDRALPGLAALLDPEAMAPRLDAALGGDAALTDVRLRYLRYKPATNIVVHYDVGLEGGRRHDAIAMSASRNYLARRAAKPENQALASLVRGRVPARSSLTYDAEIGALVQWFPLDLSLPALAEPRSVIRAELEAAGARVDGEWSTATVLAYKPRRRAVLRVGGDVVKFYAKEDEFAAAAHGLRASARLGNVLAPAPGGVLPSRRVTVQRLLPGRQPEPVEAAEAAGRMLAELHASSPCPLPAAPPGAQLKAAAATAGLIAALSETLGRRAETLLGRLARELPVGVPLVTAHGDFNSRQLLVSRDGLALVDFDGICQAPAALDLATYAAYVVLGEERALERAREVLDALLVGYGSRPPALEWYLATCILRRSARPFRYFEPDWPQRVGAMLHVAEEAA